MLTLHRSKLAAAVLTGVVAATVPGMAAAAGFQLTEQSIVGLGRAFAGSGATADDPSTLFFNAAGISQLDKSQMQFGAAVISLGADFDKTYAVDAAGQPLSGGEGGSVGKLGGVPTFYYVSPIEDTKWTWGIGVNAPYGLATDYPIDSIFRYQATYTSVSIVNVNPTVSYQATDHFSVGFGLDYQQMNVKLANMVDYGAVCYGQAGPLTCQAVGLNPQGHDGYAEVKGDGDAWGYNLGFLWTYGGTHFGLAYRSSVKHDLTGSARFENAPALFTAQGVFTNSPIKASFEVPETLSLSFSQQIDNQWRFLADITRTGWSSFDEIRIKYANPNQPDTVQPENWKDVYRYSVGVEYRTGDWTWRTGIAYDETPVNDADRTPRLPDDSRKWLSLGGTWHMSKASDLTIGYSHLWLGSGIPLDQTGATGDHIVGSYSADADIAGVEYRYIF